MKFESKIKKLRKAINITAKKKPASDKLREFAAKTSLDIIENKIKERTNER